MNSSSSSSFQGSDPRAATCRGKLQSRRCKLNQEINKELRLRAGAENLYKVRLLYWGFIHTTISINDYRLQATTNRKLRDTVALELSFVNSNLQLLKEQLAELNSSVEIYQSERWVSDCSGSRGSRARPASIAWACPLALGDNKLYPVAIENYKVGGICYVDLLGEISNWRLNVI